MSLGSKIRGLVQEASTVMAQDQLNPVRIAFILHSLRCKLNLALRRRGETQKSEFGEGLGWGT
jgi:hypothetical protein